MNSFLFKIEAVAVCLGCVTKYDKLAGLSNTNALSDIFAGWKSEMQVSAGLGPSEGCTGGCAPGFLLERAASSAAHALCMY